MVVLEVTLSTVPLREISPLLTEIAGLIRICGFLMQTKVYLFWKG